MNENENKLKLFRIILSILVICFATYNSLTNFSITDKETLCIYDYSHILLSNLNNFFKKNEILKCLFLITIGLYMDFSAIFLSHNWIIKGKSWKPIIEVIFFLAMKFMCCLLFQMKYNEDSLFGTCYFPSLIVSYKKTNDLFFSGLIGLNLLFAYNFRRLLKIYENKDNKFIKICCYLSYTFIFVQFFIDLSIRTHYIIDEIAGLVCAHFCIISTKKISEYLNKIFPLIETNIKEVSIITHSKETPMIRKGSDNYKLDVCSESY